jgi:hypothetical protein
MMVIKRPFSAISGGRSARPPLLLTWILRIKKREIHLSYNMLVSGKITYNFSLKTQFIQS